MVFESYIKMHIKKPGFITCIKAPGRGITGTALQNYKIYGI